MRGARSSDGRIVGGVLMLLGILAVIEGRRLYALREQMVAGAVVGDDTFPIIVGAALVVLGVNLLFLARLPAVQVEPPGGAVRARMLWSAGVLAAYWVVLPYLGYTGSTALTSVALYRTMGDYRWAIAVLLGAVTTAALYLMFRVWLLEPLPTGVLGF